MYKEGKASIRYHDEAFLNPVAKFSRDVSVAFVGMLADRRSKILDPTASTGIRGIRYYKETKSKDITLIDINEDAYKSLVSNLRFNKVKAPSKNMSIQEFANTSFEKFDFIDFDPFGGVSTNINDLMKLSKDGTYLMVTATDGAVLSGAHTRACIRLYDARPLHNELCHEVGLRILIGHIARIAAQYNFGIRVLLSFSYVHYIRIFIKLIKGSDSALASVDSMGYVHYCNSCLWHGHEMRFYPKGGACPLCGGSIETAGKLWLGELWERATVKRVEAEMRGRRMDADEVLFMSNLSKELQLPLFYAIPKFTKKMRISAVSPAEVVAYLKRKGFEASYTIFEKDSVRSDAGVGEIQAAIRYVKSGMHQ